MRQFMKRFGERFEAMAMAVAYAEAGEWSTAQDILDRNQSRRQPVLDRNQDKKSDRRPRMRV